MILKVMQLTDNRYTVPMQYQYSQSPTQVHLCAVACAVTLTQYAQSPTQIHLSTTTSILDFIYSNSSKQFDVVYLDIKRHLIVFPITNYLVNSIVVVFRENVEVVQELPD